MSAACCLLSAVCSPLMRSIPMSSIAVAAKTQPLAKQSKSRSLYSDALRRFRRNRVALAGLIVLVLLILTAIFAPLLALYDPTHQYLNHKLDPPNGLFPLGADNLGRDVYSRMLYGAR